MSRLRMLANTRLLQRMNWEKVTRRLASTLTVSLNVVCLPCFVCPNRSPDYSLFNPNAHLLPSAE